MMKLAVLSLLTGAAAAFAPAATKTSSSKLMAFENELGAQEPLGFYVSSDDNGIG